MRAGLLEEQQGPARLPSGADESIATAFEALDSAQAELVDAIHLYSLGHLGPADVGQSRSRLALAHEGLHEALDSAGIDRPASLSASSSVPVDEITARAAAMAPALARLLAALCANDPEHTDPEHVRAALHRYQAASNQLVRAVTHNLALAWPSIL